MDTLKTISEGETDKEKWRPSCSCLSVTRSVTKESEKYNKNKNMFTFRCVMFSYSSCVHVEGLSIRWPSFSSLNSSSTGTPGYGEPPRVKISQSSTPNDQLQPEPDMSIIFCINKCLTHIPPSPNFKVKHSILTHHFGVCISGQTEPQEPSTSLAIGPVGKIFMVHYVEYVLIFVNRIKKARKALTLVVFL